MNAKRNFNQKLIAVSIVAAFGSVAQADEASDLTEHIKPDSSVSVGVGAVNGNSSDRSIFGQYSGMREHSGYGLVDIDMVKRDDATGTWTTFQGRNLGLDNRDLSFSQQRQGDWKYVLSYDELVRRDPRTINTGLQGAGTTTPTVSLLGAPRTGADLNLELKRKSLGLSGEKWITPNLMLDISFKTEDKDGSRLFGKGFACTSGTAPGCLGPSATATGWALLMLPEPVNSTTRQFEAKLNYSGDKFLVTGGYYGSFYSNSNGSLAPTVPGTLNNQLGNPLPLSTGLQSILNLPVALPPDNQAHQLYLSGNYTFTPTTRANFKLAYSHATQNDSFTGAGLSGAPAGRSDLGGVVDTKLAQFGITSRPMSKLSLSANLRYESKKDKTPIEMYNVEGTTVFSNSQLSNRKLAGKVEATYQFLPKTRGTFGIDYQSINRELPPATNEVAGLSGLRGKTEETGYRLELRQTMTDNFSGAIAYSSSKRTGSDWYSLLTTAAANAAGVGYGATASSGALLAVSPNAIFPMMLTDRNRDKIKLAADWSPIDRVALQFLVEDGKDHYKTGNKGLRATGMTLYSFDATFNVSDTWKVNGYVSRGDQTLNVNHSTGYIASLRNTTDTFGLGVVGSPSGRLQVGADLSYSDDVSKYDQSLDPAASANNQAFLAASGGLPDVTFRLTTLKLFAKYSMAKNADLRFDLVHQNAKLNEWTWGYNGVPFVYSDGSTVGLNPNQKVTFLGARYIYKWQ